MPRKGCTECQLRQRRHSCSSLWRTSGTARAVGTPGKSHPPHVAFCTCTMVLNKATGCGCRTGRGSAHARNLNNEACCKQASVSFRVEWHWVEQAGADKFHRHEQALGRRDDTDRRCRRGRAGHKSASRAGSPPGTVGTWMVWGCSPACCRWGSRKCQARSTGMDNGLLCILSARCSARLRKQVARQAGGMKSRTHERDSPGERACTEGVFRRMGSTSHRRI